MSGFLGDLDGATNNLPASAVASISTATSLLCVDNFLIAENFGHLESTDVMLGVPGAIEQIL